MPEKFFKYQAAYMLPDAHVGDLVELAALPGVSFQMTPQGHLVWPAPSIPEANELSTETRETALALVACGFLQQEN